MTARLDAFQQSRVDHAREVLAVSAVSHEPETYGFYLGSLEVVADNLLAVIDSLTRPGGSEAGQ